MLRLLKSLVKFFLWGFAVVGILFLLVFGGAIYAVTKYAKDRIEPTEHLPQKIALYINFNNDLVEQPSAPSLGALVNVVGDDRELSIHDIVRALHMAKNDPNVLGVVGSFKKNAPSLAQAQEIMPALKAFRDSKKFSYAFSTGYGGFGPGANAYYMASAFENVWLQPVGTVGLTNIRLELPFARGLLDKIGVQPEFLQREEYKGAMQVVTEQNMTAPVKENMMALVQSLNEQLTAGIAQNRTLTPESVSQLMNSGPYTAEQALQNKLIDKVGYFDEIESEIKEKQGTDVTLVSIDEYLFKTARRNFKPEDLLDKHKEKSSVALIFATGEIVDEDRSLSPMTGDNVVVGEHLADAFYEAAKDKDIKTILFRVDSPGGSPAGSETIRRAIVKAQEAGKKVYVSMGSVAGSGGYWIAMNGDKIFADAATLTGSIGVLTGKFVLSGLYEKLGVNWSVLQTSGDESFAPFSSLHPFTEAEKQKMDALIDETYQTFRANVGKARKLSVEQLDLVTKGRVFSGKQAKENGLVDEIGNFQDVVNYTKKELGLTPDDKITITLLPRRPTPAEEAQKMLRYFFRQSASLPDFGVMLGGAMKWAEQQATTPHYKAEMQNIRLR